MPTSDRTAHFDRDYATLSPGDRLRFREAVRRFVVDLDRGSFRKGLWLKRIEGAPGIFEMTRAPHGRATFRYGATRGGEPHGIWRRIGTRDVFSEPWEGDRTMTGEGETRVRVRSRLASEAAAAREIPSVRPASASILGGLLE